MGEEADIILETVSGLQVDLILMTHNHFDHIDGIAEADVELKDGVKIPFDGKGISVIHTPGHTLFTVGWGNTVFKRGSKEAIFNSIRRKIMALPSDIIVYPGHGEETTIGQERSLYF